MKLGILYSGGKDSNYVLFKAKQEHDIMCLINIQSENENSYMFQSVGNTLLALQADSLGIPLLKYKTKGEKELELEDLKKAIIQAKEKYGIQGICTGAIKSCYQASRIQKICCELNIFCYNPIWQIDEDEYMDELLKNGFDIRIFGIFSYPFTKKILGKQINKEFLEELKGLRNEYKISIAGEGGEYESFILDSPDFKKKLDIKDFQISMDSENSGIVKTCDTTQTNKKIINDSTIPSSISSQSSGLVPQSSNDILIIQITSQNDDLYYLEYINPVIKVIKQANLSYKTLHFSELDKIDINNFKKIIICGTSLQQNDYLDKKSLKNFDWLQTTKTPVLGICAGAQIILKCFNGKLLDNLEIGLKKPQILKEDNIIKKIYLLEIYTLHSKTVSVPDSFEIMVKTNQCPQIAKHKKRSIYTTQFHPEVRNKFLIFNFLKN